MKNYLFPSILVLLANSVSAAPPVSDLYLGMGVHPSEKNITFYTPANYSDTLSVQIAPSANIIDGEYPVDATSFAAINQLTYTGFRSHKITVTGLTASTRYSYRVGNASDGWGPTYEFSTVDDERFNFIVAGDPQIGAAGFRDATVEQAFDRAQTWQRVMSSAFNLLPNSSFFLAPGDIVQRPYESYFSAVKSADIVRILPSVMLEASHDDDELDGDISIFHQHFYQPQPTTPAAPYKGFFWFKHGDVLFISADPFNNGGADPRPYIAQAVEQYPDTKWRIFTIHYSYYAAAFHANAYTSPILRQQMAPLLDNMGIDLVIFGHDHSYLRTPQLLNDQVVPATNLPGDLNSAVNPQGAVYLTANSSSGSKYYRLVDDIYSRYYTAHARQTNTPSFVNIEIDGNDLYLKAYEVDDENNITLFDQYRIHKTGIRPVQSQDYDSDGILNVDDVFPFDPTEWADVDGDGIGDNSDDDSDNDGITDDIDPLPFTPYTPLTAGTGLQHCPLNAP